MWLVSRVGCGFAKCNRALSSRRFTTFWALRGRPAGQAKRLIENRQATMIQIKDSDSFFRELADKVSALEDLSGLAQSRQKSPP